MLWNKQLGAEFVGTFILIFFATAAPIVNQKYNGAETLIGNAGCAGLAVMIDHDFIDTELHPPIYRITKINLLNKTNRNRKQNNKR